MNMANRTDIIGVAAHTPIPLHNPNKEHTKLTPRAILEGQPTEVDLNRYSLQPEQPTIYMEPLPGAFDNGPTSQRKRRPKETIESDTVIFQPTTLQRIARAADDAIYSVLRKIDSTKLAVAGLTGAAAIIGAATLARSPETTAALEQQTQNEAPLELKTSPIVSEASKTLITKSAKSASNPAETSSIPSASTQDGPQTVVASIPAEDIQIPSIDLAITDKALENMIQAQAQQLIKEGRCTTTFKSPIPDPNTNPADYTDLERKMVNDRKTGADNMIALRSQGKPPGEARAIKVELGVKSYLPPCPKPKIGFDNPDFVKKLRGGSAQKSPQK